MRPVNSIEGKAKVEAVIKLYRGEYPADEIDAVVTDLLTDIVLWAETQGMDIHALQHRVALHADSEIWL